jgi:hypothetical protein
MMFQTEEKLIIKQRITQRVRVSVRKSRGSESEHEPPHSRRSRNDRKEHRDRRAKDDMSYLTNGFNRWSW